jgi:hypothetical protein
MRLSIDYKLTGLGWAECIVADESRSCTVSASYLSDALRSLVLAATAVASGFRAVTFRFDEEPGEYRWVIRSPRLNEVELSILEFPQLWGDRPDEEGQEIFQTKCLPLTFAEAVLAAAKNLRESLGESGYAEKWAEHPFPVSQLQELERLLTQGEADA